MSWAEIPISSLGRIVTGKTPETSNRLFYDGDYPFITPSDIGFNHYICRSTESTVSDLARDRLPNQFIPGGSVIVTCIGNTIGKTAIAPRDCLTNQQMNSIVVSDEHDAKFVYYLMCNAVGRIRGVGLGGGAAQPIINKTTFSALKVFVPHKGIQAEIANVLSAYDDLISNNERRIGLLERSARLLFEEWFVHLRYPGYEHDTIIDGVPEGWVSGKVEDFFETTSGGTPSRRRLDFYSGSIPWVKTQELYKHFVIDTGEKITDEAIALSSAKLFPAKTVIVAMYGATIGEASILAIEAATNQACCALMPRHNPNSWIFAYLFFKTFQDKLVGLSQGAAQNNVSQGIIRQFPMVSPDAVTMAEFCTVAIPMLDQIRVLQMMGSKLATARDLLLPRLMDGRIAV